MTRTIDMLAQIERAIPRMPDEQKAALAAKLGEHMTPVSLVPRVHVTYPSTSRVCCVVSMQWTNGLGVSLLQSYDVIVAAFVTRPSDWPRAAWCPSLAYSRTSRRHVNDFFSEFGLDMGPPEPETLDTKQFEAWLAGMGVTRA